MIRGDILGDRRLHDGFMSIPNLKRSKGRSPNRSICSYKPATTDDGAKVIEHYGTGNLTVKLAAALRPPSHLQTTVQAK
jgi:hypothetical protein